MKKFTYIIIILSFVAEAHAENVRRNIPYAVPANERQMLDVYALKTGRTGP